MKLTVGTAAPGADGWTTVDLVDADIRAPMWKIPLPSAGVEAVRCIHALEHVSAAHVEPTLREFFRVLVPGAQLQLEVPDLTYVCSEWMDKRDRRALQLLFGLQDRPGQFHLTGFNSQSLRSAVERAGFIVDSVGPIWSFGQRSVRLEGHRPLR